MRNAASLLIAFAAFFYSVDTFAVIEEDPVTRPSEFEASEGLYLEYMNYEDYVYSRSKKTELGDQVEVDVGLRYQFNPSTFGRVRFETDPVRGRYSNKTSQFEILVGYDYGPVYFQGDAELNTNSDDNGGISLGGDVDSELTLISYRLSDRFKFTFYPFNFDSEVGKEFNTWDVTRIYYIDGSPSDVDDTPPEDVQVAEKTIPGLELSYRSEGSVEFSAYVGLGAATYLYPGDANFDIRDTTTANRWERREDLGFKLGGGVRSDDYRVELEYASHSEAAETGALLEAGASIYSIFDIHPLIVEAEVTRSRAGERAYRIDRGTNWFEKTTIFSPVYSDRSGNLQDWLGEADNAYSLRLGFKFDDSVPYLTYKYQGEHFIYSERLSAHLLRTADESQSHGGLTRVGFGSFFYYGKFVVNPEFEYLIAENPVFTSSSDVRADRFLSAFRKEDFMVFLTISYQFGESRIFSP